MGCRFEIGAAGFKGHRRETVFRDHLFDLIYFGLRLIGLLLQGLDVAFAIGARGLTCSRWTCGALRLWLPCIRCQGGKYQGGHQECRHCFHAFSLDQVFR